MSENLIPIEETFYSDYFEGLECQGVFLLREDKAKLAWSQEIEPNSSSYFDLSDECWIVKGKPLFVGRWLEAFNNDDNNIVAEALRSTVQWSDETVIKFFAKKNAVFQTTWGEFLKVWDGFLTAEDDCPIIIPEFNNSRLAFLFRPIGDILFIRNDV